MPKLKYKYVFDVDGTLTASRCRINSTFALWFIDFIAGNDVYFVTGSDRPKTVEQLGEFIYSKAKVVYQCSGNQAFLDTRQLYNRPMHVTDELYQALDEELMLSDYSERTGNHIEDRECSLNFSVVGRNANVDQRDAYVAYDNSCHERICIATRLSERFSDYQFQVAGDTGIDVVKRGKEQIMDDFNSDDHVVFFGDKMDSGGNDYSLAQANSQGTNHHVKDWNDTWKILRAL